MKYPAVYIYKKTADNGQELRYSIRSLKNLKNWNGEVFVVGDKEDWFKGIVAIPAPKYYYSPYQDAENKMLIALDDDRIDDDFILMNDDIYITKKTSVRPLHGGEIEDSNFGYHNRAKTATKKFLQDQGIKRPLNYSIHVPMLINKQKRLEVHKMIRGSFNGTALLARIVYGNIFNIGGEYYEDKKTKTQELKKGEFISTQFFTSELEKKFPKQSPLEVGDFIVYDNTEDTWSRRYSIINRENGANTYSKEILEHQIPLLEKHIKKCTISTTNLLSKIKRPILSDVNIQYLHTYPIADPLTQVDEVLDVSPNTIFIVSYAGLHEAIREYGYKSIFIPMTIDTNNLPQKARKLPKIRNKSIIYYGNVTSSKQDTFDKVKKFFEDKKWKFDYISEGKFNGEGEKLSQEECWDILKTYNYGIGVGRCYMEMSAMGLKCIVAGNNIGGITTEKRHHKDQVKTNYNSNYATFSDDLDEIFKNLDKIKPQYEDIEDNIELIEERIREVL